MKSVVVKKGRDVGIEIYWTQWQLEALIQNYQRCGYKVVSKGDTKT